MVRFSDSEKAIMYTGYKKGRLKIKAPGGVNKFVKDEFKAVGYLPPLKKDIKRWVKKFDENNEEFLLQEDRSYLKRRVSIDESMAKEIDAALKSGASSREACQAR